jgi:hypothetical protein
MPHSGAASFNLGDCDELQTAAPNPTQLRADVLIEEVTTAPQCLCGFGRRQRKPRRTRGLVCLSHCTSISGGQVGVSRARTNINLGLPSHRHRIVSTVSWDCSSHMRVMQSPGPYDHVAHGFVSDDEKAIFCVR